MTGRGLIRVAADPVQSPGLVERMCLAPGGSPSFLVYAQCLIYCSCRAWLDCRPAVDHPQLNQGVGFAAGRSP